MVELSRIKRNFMILSFFNSFKAILVLLVVGWFLFFSQNIAFTASSPDAIAVRVIPNPGHYSVLRWYRDQGFTGSPQSLIVDGYEAIRDGRTVYVNAANVDLANNILYTNIYLISYNQEAEQATQDIFGQLISHWQFNTNLAKGETASGQEAACSQDSSIICISDKDCLGQGYCNSFKSQVTRDTIRLARMNDIDKLIADYSQNNNHYPKLSAGTYLPKITISVWPSWQDTLGQSLGSTLSIDPINQLASCPGYDSITCWNEETKEFKWTADIKNNTLPPNNYVFLYQADEQGASYKLCAFSETGLIEEAKSCNSECIPICFNKECGDNSCGGTCLPGCSPTQICLNSICYHGCNTGPGCRPSLTNGHIVAGYCLSGDCYQCDYGYSWGENSCEPTCDITCNTDPGCRTSLNNGHTVSGECCGNGYCYECDTNYVWNPSTNTCESTCNVTCNTDPGCRASLNNGHTVSGECCGNGYCYECDANYVWNPSTNTCESTCNVTCNTGPGCRASLANGHTTTGDCCGNGQCYECAPGYAWDDQTNACVCAPTCSTGPGCRTASFPNAIIVGGPEECCGNGSCYECDTNYVWNPSTNTCESTCNITCITGPGCRVSLTHGQITTGECCGNGQCYECNANYTWNGSICECPNVNINNVNNATIYAYPSGAIPPLYYGPTLFDTTASITDAQIVTYNLSGNPSWLIINSPTGEMQGTQTTNTQNIYQITVTAENACGETDSTTFQLTVLPNQWCGDNVINGSEQCDDGDLGGATCETQGFGGGNLSCDSSCNYNTDSCYTSQTCTHSAGANWEPYGTVSVKFENGNYYVKIDGSHYTAHGSNLHCSKDWVGGLSTSCYYAYGSTISGSVNLAGDVQKTVEGTFTYCNSGICQTTTCSEPF